MARSCPKLLLASVLAGTATAAPPPQPAPATQAAPPAPAAPDQPINLDAASTEVDYRTNTLVFRDVVISQGSTRVQAEHARATGLNFANSRWTFEGKVRIDGEQHGALRSDQATVEFRENRIARATITGKPAEFEQKRNDSDQLARGDVVGLLGPNGAGKTTAFYMIVGLVPCDAGRIRLEDTDVTLLPMHRRAQLGLGYLPQEASVFRKLNVEANVMAILETRSDLERAAREERLEQLLEELRIGHVRRTLGMALSGGERRR